MVHEVLLDVTTVGGQMENRELGQARLDAEIVPVLITGELSSHTAKAAPNTAPPGEVFHWPPGHSVRIDRDAELILFSPQAEHTPVLDHMLAKLETT